MVVGPKNRFRRVLEENERARLDIRFSVFKATFIPLLSEILQLTVLKK
jgi:hypothetical protein